MTRDLALFAPYRHLAQRGTLLRLNDRSVLLMTEVIPSEIFIFAVPEFSTNT